MRNQIRGGILPQPETDGGEFLLEFDPCVSHKSGGLKPSRCADDCKEKNARYLTLIATNRQNYTPLIALIAMLKEDDEISTCMFSTHAHGAIPQVCMVVTMAAYDSMCAKACAYAVGTVGALLSCRGHDTPN